MTKAISLIFWKLKNVAKNEWPRNVFYMNTYCIELYCIKLYVPITFAHEYKNRTALKFCGPFRLAQLAYHDWLGPKIQRLWGPWKVYPESIYLGGDFGNRWLGLRKEARLAIHWGFHPPRLFVLRLQRFSKFSRIFRTHPREKDIPTEK